MKNKTIKLEQASFAVADNKPASNDMKQTKTLIMNYSHVIENEASGYDTYAALSQIVEDRGRSIISRIGTPFEIVFEAEAGAARFGYYSANAVDGFYFEALVLGSGQGRHCWPDFHNWCEHLISHGRAQATNLAASVPDANAWNCVILENTCDQLADEDFNELISLQWRLANAYVSHLDQNGRLIRHVRR